MFLCGLLSRYVLLFSWFLFKFRVLVVVIRRLVPILIRMAVVVVLRLVPLMVLLYVVVNRWARLFLLMCRLLIFLKYLVLVNRCRTFIGMIWMFRRCVRFVELKELLFELMGMAFLAYVPNVSVVMTCLVGLFRPSRLVSLVNILGPVGLAGSSRLVLAMLKGMLACICIILCVGFRQLTLVSS